MGNGVNSIEGFSSVISINDLKIPVNLGVTDGERDAKQEVSISLKFFCRHEPAGCVTDSIKDTICYHKISDSIVAHCSGRKFKLLEYLCKELYGNIRAGVNHDIKIWIKVEKLNPPVGNRLASTAFEYNDIWQ